MANSFWMGPYEPLNLFGLFIQATFIENFLLANFLGMCSYLSCSTRIKTAHGLGLSVIFVLTISGVLNWLIHQYLTKEGALSWLSSFGIDTSQVDLSFLEFLLFISVIAGFTQIVEIMVEHLSPRLYRTLGIYLPLIAVNCTILGACLFATIREYPFIPNLIYVFGSGVGWWIAIILMAAIREKLAYSNPPKGLSPIALTFIMTGIMALGFQAFQGINLATPTKAIVEEIEEGHFVENEKATLEQEMASSFQKPTS